MVLANSLGRTLAVMGGREVRRMRKSKGSTAEPTRSFVDFRFEDTTYQIDPAKRKVYRSFVEVETSRASHIIACFHGTAPKQH
jgi:hypothetical protein